MTSQAMFARVIPGTANCRILYCEDGRPVTRIDADLYPVDSEISTRHQHPEGIVLTIAQVDRLGIPVEL